MSEIFGAIVKYGLALLALAAVAYMGSKAFASNTVSTTATGIEQLVNNAHQMYPNKTYPTTVGSMQTTLAQANMIPSSISSTGAENGTPTAFGANIAMVGLANGQMQMTIPSTTITNAECTALGSAVANVATTMVVGTTSVIGPINPASVAQACQNAPGTLTLTFD